PSGSEMPNDDAVNGRLSVGVMSLMVGPPVAGSLTLATAAVGAENTSSSVPLPSWYTARTRNSSPTRLGTPMPPTYGSAGVKWLLSSREISPAAKWIRSMKTPEPGRCSTCQKYETGPVIAPVGLVAVTLSASVTPAIDTVS